MWVVCRDENLFFLKAIKSENKNHFNTVLRSIIKQLCHMLKM